MVVVCILLCCVVCVCQVLNYVDMLCMVVHGCVLYVLMWYNMHVIVLYGGVL